MFNVGDYVFHSKTGRFGKVIGFGHEMLDRVYETTLQVLVVDSRSGYRTSLVEEDLHSEWVSSSLGQTASLSQAKEKFTMPEQTGFEPSDISYYAA